MEDIDANEQAKIRVPENFSISGRREYLDVCRQQITRNNEGNWPKPQFKRLGYIRRRIGR